MKKRLCAVVCLLLLGAALLSACSPKKEFVVENVFCITDRKLNGDVVYIGDTRLYGKIGGKEYTVAVKVAFAEYVVVDYHGEYAKDDPHDTQLSSLWLRVRDADGVERELTLRPGDRFSVKSADIVPVIVLSGD